MVVTPTFGFINSKGVPDEDTPFYFYAMKSQKKSVSLQAKDNVNHPAHYNSHPSGIECIEIARHYCFSIGNAIKYLWRAGLKQDAALTDLDKEIEDLKKAKWYIDDRIKELEQRKAKHAQATTVGT